MVGVPISASSGERALANALSLSFSKKVCEDGTAADCCEETHDDKDLEKPAAHRDGSRYQHGE